MPRIQKKWVYIFFQQFETSRYRVHQSYILRLPELRLWVPRAIRRLETSFPRLRPSRFFWCTGCRKWVSMAFRHLERSLHRIHQSHFLRRPEGKFSTLGHSPTWNITSANSSNSLFWMARMQKIRLHGLSTPRNISWSTSPKSNFKTSRRKIHRFTGPFMLLKHNWRLRSSRFFGCPEWKNYFTWPFDSLKHRLIIFTSHILRRSEGRLWVLMAIRLLETTSANSPVFFWIPRMEKMNSRCLSTPWNIVSSTNKVAF
jgi:hypothetical protein